ncbi:MAG: HAMP domain-containing methyl-accepting chemotaxis protein [Methanoregula sp.]
MSFIDDMKIGKKLIGGFLIVVAILAIVGAFAYINIQTLKQNTEEVYDGNLLPVHNVDIMESGLWQLRGDIYKYAYTPAARGELDVSIPLAFKDVDNAISDFRKSNPTPEEQAILVKMETSWSTYKTGLVSTMADAKAGKNVDSAFATGGSLVNARAEVLQGVTDLLTINLNEAKKTNEDAGNEAASVSMVLIIAIIAAIVISIAIALYLTKSITAPIDLVSKNLKELSKGHLGNRMKLNRKDEIGEMATVMDEFSDDLQTNVIGTMKKIADGDLSVDVKAKDAQDEISPALKMTTESLRALVAEATMLSKAAVEGKLATRGNPDKFKGGYRDIVSGVNQTLDSVVGPVNEAMRISNEYAKGNFTARVDEKLNVQGDFVAFKQALNNIGIEVSKSLTAINEQVNDLAASAEEANASVEEVSAGSSQVAKNANGVSVNAEKATQGIEQVQKAMEDLSRTIQDVATKSEAVAKIVQDTTTFSKEGMELAQKTEQGMQGITKSSNDVNQIIGEIKDQMDKISEIVNLITDLANQTNLLALNAAIEAARAGDAGRGFAVVATEVKSLAVESRASAERISEMIDNLQKQTVNAVDAVAASNNGVREGSEALHETLTSFSKIVSSIDKISQNVSDVAAAAEEQAASVEEVTASVNEVGGLMQNTTSEATDAAAASEESSAAIDQITKVVANVNSIVDKVTKEVSKFRI